MAINFNFKIEKKDLWLLSAIMVFLVGIAYVIAYGGNNPAVMGHSAGEIEIGLDCIIVNCSTAWSCTTTCPSGYTITGGGGDPNTNGDLILSKPEGNGWHCGVNLGGTCYASCCKLD